MTGMSLSDILDILAERHGDVKLKDATYTARCILELSRNVTDAVAQESYNKGHSDGYELGKRDAEVPSNFEMAKLRRMHDFQTKRANELIPGIVARLGRDKKISCIKELRNETGLGLKETKDIVDAFIVKLEAVTPSLADWERDLLDGASNYSDEPPF